MFEATARAGGPSGSSWAQTAPSTPVGSEQLNVKAEVIQVREGGPRRRSDEELVARRNFYCDDVIGRFLSFVNQDRRELSFATMEFRTLQETVAQLEKSVQSLQEEGTIQKSHQEVQKLRESISNTEVKVKKYLLKGNACHSDTASETDPDKKVFGPKMCETVRGSENMN